MTERLKDPGQTARALGSDVEISHFKRVGFDEIPARLDRFAKIVMDAGFSSPIRTPRGQDILAACGQLRTESRRLGKRDSPPVEAAVGPDAGRVI